MGLSMEASSASACISLATWVRKEVPSPTPSGRPVAELARLELCTEPSPRDWRKASSTAALVPSSSSASAGGLVCSMRVPVRKVRGDSPGSWLQAAEPGGLALGPIPARGEAAEEELGERARGAGESAGARAEAAEEDGESARLSGCMDACCEGTLFALSTSAESGRLKYIDGSGARISMLAV
mmetsp:Transcript_1546/g.3245  ORF Transcript_1546/g.3245 Transcript_1546/m.3245 type:complete len:183 (+) Transcript_1546:889-1437(+)